MLKQIKWLTRVPLSIKEAKNLVSTVKNSEFKNSEISGYSWVERESNYGGIPQRWLVVKSEARTKSDLTSLEKKITKEFFADSVFLKSPRRISTMAMLMGLCLMVYSLGQREVRRQLSSANTGIPNQLGKLTDRPTLRWIFQCFQGIHLLVHQGIKQVVNLTAERQLTLKFFPLSCQQYYLLSG